MCHLGGVFDDIAKTIGIPINQSHTVAIFRMRNGSIVVKFFSISAKQQVFINYLRFQNLNVSHIGFDGTQRIYINESLCKETAILFKIANRMRRNGLLFKVCTRKGILLIQECQDGKLIKITSGDQLGQNDTGRPSISRVGELLNDPNFTTINVN